jgi:hypothetical protein
MDDIITDKEEALAALQKGKFYDEDIIQRVSESLRNNKEFILEAMQHNRCVLKYTSKDLQDDKEVVLKAAKQNQCVLEFASEVEQSGLALKYASEQDGRAPRCVSDETSKNDKEVDLKPVEQDGRASRYVSETLKNEKEVDLKPAEQVGEALKSASQHLQNDQELLAIIQECKLCV